MIGDRFVLTIILLLSYFVFIQTCGPVCLVRRYVAMAFRVYACKTCRRTYNNGHCYCSYVARDIPSIHCNGTRSNRLLRQCHTYIIYMVLRIDYLDRAVSSPHQTFYVTRTSTILLCQCTATTA